MALAAASQDYSDKSEWFRCRPWIEAALEYANGTYTIEDVEDGIAEGRLYFFCSENAAVIAEILEYPRLKALNFFLVGGDLDELRHQIEPAVSKWAKEQMGCTKAFGIGRKGFEKAFKANGYTPCWTAISKDLR